MSVCTVYSELPAPRDKPDASALKARPQGVWLWGACAHTEVGEGPKYNIFQATGKVWLPEGAECSEYSRDSMLPLKGSWGGWRGEAVLLLNF